MPTAQFAPGRVSEVSWTGTRWCPEVWELHSPGVAENRLGGSKVRDRSRGSQKQAMEVNKQRFRK